MAQSPVLHGSGLERDCRQDEFPTRYLGGQNDSPTAYNNIVVQPVMPEKNSNLPSHKSAAENPKRVCGLRISTFWLTVIFLGLAGVGAGVLGSRITSKKNDSSEPKRCVRSSGLERQGPYMYY